MGTFLVQANTKETMLRRYATRRMELYNGIKKYLPRIISSIIFALLFVLIIYVFEFFYPGEVLKDFTYYVNTYLRMGLK